MKKKLWIILCTSFVILVCAVPFIKEYKIYSKAKAGNTIYSCDEYLDEYPNGMFAESIQEIREQISYEAARDFSSPHYCDDYLTDYYPDGKYTDEVRYLKVLHTDNSMDAINEYIEYSPSGKYIAAVNAICDSIWDSEITKFQNRDKQRESTQAINFMTEMLAYMKTHRVNKVLVNVTSHLQLKDYTEYSENVKDYIDILYSNTTLPIRTNMISLKSNFSEEEVSTLKDILANGVQKSLNKIFTPGFISVVTDEETEKQMPMLNFDYTIKSQEVKLDGVTIPNIWTYSVNNIPIKYLVGISIHFNAHYSLPNSDVSFSYSEKGEPANSIDDIDDISDGYRKMSTICFAQFSNKMARNMGLKETYFQGDNEE